MLYNIGRVLQGIGLFVTLPLALAGSMLNEIDQTTFYMLTAAGVGLFIVGYLIQQSGKPS